jgi:hypothetical protein
VAISVRPETAASSFGTPGSTQAIVVPSTVIAGDIIAAFWHAEDNGTTNPTLTAPAGEGYTAYSDVENTSSTPDFHHKGFWKIADSGDAGQTHTWSVSNCSWLGAILVIISGGQSTGDPNVATPTTQTGGRNANVVAPDITPSTAPWLEGTVADSFDGASASPPAGMTEAVDLSGFCFDYLRQTTTSAPGTRTIVQTTGDPNPANFNDWIGAHYGFIEAAVAGPDPRARRRLMALMAEG